MMSHVNDALRMSMLTSTSSFASAEAAVAAEAEPEAPADEAPEFSSEDAL